MKYQRFNIFDKITYSEIVIYFIRSVLLYTTLKRYCTILLIVSKLIKANECKHKVSLRNLRKFSMSNIARIQLDLYNKSLFGGNKKTISALLDKFLKLREGFVI